MFPVGSVPNALHLTHSFAPNHPATHCHLPTSSTLNQLHLTHTSFIFITRFHLKLTRPHCTFPILTRVTCFSHLPPNLFFSDSHLVRLQSPPCASSLIRHTFVPVLFNGTTHPFHPLQPSDSPQPSEHD
eukprot:GHVN01079131.1.p1 GENE.GHVN01079131.1~~GHVN01079131.1.p1  ORF type:complete len:129 (-),score=25.89 GHVN01079131.1:1121-1507(-)